MALFKIRQIAFFLSNNLSRKMTARKNNGKCFVVVAVAW